MEQLSWRTEDQFDSISSSEGWTSIQLRKKRENSDPDAYEYRIGEEALLNTYSSLKQYEDIIRPKPPGKWIDLKLENKNLYLYLECFFTIESLSRSYSTGNPNIYDIVSAELITKEQLPDNFSGEYPVRQNTNGFNYYDITLGRILICMFSKNNPPIIFHKNNNIQLGIVCRNGLCKPKLF